jgi:hypothetical protein
MSRIVAAVIVCIGLFALGGAIREAKTEACTPHTIHKVT